MQPVSNLESPTLPKYLEQIIDKKVNNLSLGIFEKITHLFLTICSCFYPSYNRQYTYNAHQMVIVNEFLKPFPNKAERLHYFSDRTKVLDLTANKIFCMGLNPDANEIFLNNRRVVFSLYRDEVIDGQIVQKGREIFFGREQDTIYLKIEDSLERQGEVLISEYKTENRINKWVVDTKKKFSQEGWFFGTAGLTPAKNLVYVTEDVIPKIKDDNYLQQEI